MKSHGEVVFDASAAEHVRDLVHDGSSNFFQKLRKPFVQSPRVVEVDADAFSNARRVRVCSAVVVRVYD
jgi:hypothetical protein